MRVGATISGAGHLGLLALAVIGPEPASAPEDRVIQARDVSIVSLAAFNAAVSEAPEVPDVAASALNAPEVSQSVNETPAELEAAEAVPEAEVPDAPDPDAAPDLSTFAIPDPELTTVAPEPDPAPIGEDLPLLAGPSFDGSLNSNETTLRAPAPAALAPRIDTSAAPKPPERSEAAPLPREASISSDQKEQLPEEEAAAPEAATTEITPDAVEQEEVHTPTAAMRPPGRPRALVAEKPRPRSAPKRRPGKLRRMQNGLKKKRLQRLWLKLRLNPNLRERGWVATFLRGKSARLAHLSTRSGTKAS